MSRVFLAVLTGYDPASMGLVNLYFASGRGYVSRPGDTPPSTAFEGRLLQPLTIRRDLFASGATYGRSQIALGQVVLNNAGGELDYLNDLAYDGRPIALYYGPEEGSFPADFSLMFQGTMEQMEWAERTITLRVRDRQFETKTPVQPVLYAGDNILPAGVEGTASDIKGQPKPLLFGKCFNVPAVLVNSSRLIYQLHSGALQDVVALYDRGVALTKGTSRASLAALEGTAPAAGAFDYWLGGGMIRLGSSPDGTITADAIEGATPADRTAAQVFQRVLLYGNVPLDQISVPAIAILDDANFAEIGIHIAVQRTIADVLDDIANSVGAWWGQTPDGRFTIERFVAPTGAPVATFQGSEEILSLRRLPSADAGAGLPVWRVVLGYQKNNAVQAGDSLASSVTADRRAWLESEYRTVARQDTAVQAVHLRSPTLELDTLLVEESAAAEEAERIRVLRGVRRDRYEGVFPFDEETEQPIALGSVVEVVYDRYGLGAGRRFRVISLAPDAMRSRLNLTLWG